MAWSSRNNGGLRPLSGVEAMNNNLLTALPMTQEDIADLVNRTRSNSDLAKKNAQSVGRIANSIAAIGRRMDKKNDQISHSADPFGEMRMTRSRTKEPIDAAARFLLSQERNRERLRSQKRREANQRTRLWKQLKRAIRHPGIEEHW